MALHTVHWLKYVLIGWPVASFALTPFLARFVALSSDPARPTQAPDGEAEIAIFGLVAPMHSDELT